MNVIFSTHSPKNVVVVRRGIKNVQAQFDRVDALNVGHEYLLLYGKSPEVRFPKILVGEGREVGSWNSHWRGTDRPTMRYELFGITPDRGQWRWSRERSLKAIENYQRMVRELGGDENAITQDMIDAWYRNQVDVTGEKIDLLRLSKAGTPEHYVPPSAGTLLSDLWEDIQASNSKELAALVGSIVYTNPKSTKLLERVITVAGSDEATILDFFAGSGTTAHAVINLNREDGGKRKYILVEMGDWFETVLLPRIKKVVFCEKWKDGKPQGGQGTSHMLKYHYLEQYEDTLNNLELPREKEGQLAFGKFGDEYLLRYMLEFETQGSPSLLNLEMFKNPFAYKLKVQEGDEIVECPVDLVETFNYLLGIEVKKMRLFEDQDRPYRAVLGEKDGKRVVIVWRPLEGLEGDEEALMRDKAFIEGTVLPALLGEAKPDRLLVNGASFVKDAEAIEPEFYRLMFAPVGA